MVKGWVVSLGLIAAWVCAQLVVFHVTHPRQLFRTLTLLFVLSLPVYIACYLLTPPTLGFLPRELAQSPLLLGLLNGLILHHLLYVTYVAFFYYIDRPLTLRILIALLKDPQRKWTLSELQTVYQLTHMIQRRLEAMEAGRLVVEREGRYFLTPKGRRIGKFFYWGKTFLKIGRSQKQASLSNG